MNIITSESTRFFSELLSAPLLPFILGWKLSLILTDFRDILADPRLILYATGGVTNILIGVLAGVSWLGYRWWKVRPGKSGSKTLAIALITAVSAFSVLFVVDAVGHKSGEGEEFYPEVILVEPDGKVWTSFDERGKLLVLNFWASWCPPCRAEMPMLDRLADDDQYADVAFYAVNATGTEKTATSGEEWLEQNGYSIPLLLDISGNASATFGINSLPTTVILDGNGKLVEIKTALAH